MLDFTEVARADDELVARSGQQSIVFGAGDVRVVVSTALTQSSKAARYLKRHPAGVMSLSFRVRDLDQTMRLLEARGGTVLADPVEAKDARGGTYRSFEIATPLGDVAFRFVERKDFAAFAPGFVDVGAGHGSRPPNDFGIAADRPRDVERPHHAAHRGVVPRRARHASRSGTSASTRRTCSRRPCGRRLRPPSIVMWDPESDVKFATNEPLRPHFRDSQICEVRRTTTAGRACSTSPSA